MQKTNKVTVVTPTYNRAHTLDRVFNSLQVQDYNEFEWLVVDDGSTDNTEDLINSYKEKANFPVRYVKKNHEGKYEAVNLSYKLVTTPYIINLDSDDEFLPNGLSTIMKVWEELPKEVYDRVWCVTGRCIDSETKELVGEKFPDNINELTGKSQRKKLANISGEKHSCRKVDIVSKFPFPKFEDTGKLVPNMSWLRINAIYDQYCINDNISLYYQNSADSLCKSPSKERKLGYYYYAIMCINEYFDQFMYNPEIRMSFIDASRCGWIGGKSTAEILNAINNPYKRLMVMLCMPISYIYNKFFDKHRKNRR